MPPFPITLTVLRPETCEGCGLCCEGIGSPVLHYASRPRRQGPHPYRPDGLPEELIREIDEHFLGLSRGQEPRDQCLWFDPIARRCKHYEWRPGICHEYELAGPGCIALRREHLQP